MKRIGCGLCFLAAAITVFAQGSPEGAPALVPMKQLMVDVIHPASNQILLTVYRGGAQSEADWAAVRHSAAELMEAGTSLTVRGRARDDGEWTKDVVLMANAGSSAYKAAQAKDPKALADAAASLDASCAACHRRFRPDVFPRQNAK
jgi:hypothetical protein